MMKNMRIPRYKPSIPDSEISGVTTTVFADSEARADRFSRKRHFISDRADKIRYCRSLTFGRENSDASRRSITWDIEIYNQIIMNTFHVSKNLMMIQETAGRGRRRITWGFGIGGSLAAPPSHTTVRTLDVYGGSES